MAIKYTKPDSKDGKPSAAGPDVRYRQFSNAPPSRRTLSWIILGLALIITMIMIASELPSIDIRDVAEEYVWHDGTVISNDVSSGERVLRVEIPGSDGNPSHVYDIALDGRDVWAVIAAGDTVRIQTQSDASGNIERIINVESGDESTLIQELVKPIGPEN
jgi:hypothetical protein